MRNPTHLDKQLQRYAREYIESTDKKEIVLDDLANWIIRKKKTWEPDQKRLTALLRADISHALSEERFTTDGSRRVRSYQLIKRKKDNKQESLYLPTRGIKASDMKLSLQIRRNDLVPRVIQMNNDLQYFNTHNLEGVKLQLSFNFTNDILEAEASLGKKKPTASTPYKRSA